MFEHFEITAQLAYALIVAVLGAIGWWRDFLARRRERRLRPVFEETVDFLANHHAVIEAGDLLAKHEAPDSRAARLLGQMKRKNRALMEGLSAEAPRLDAHVQNVADSVGRVVQTMRASGADDQEILEALLEPGSNLLANAVVAGRDRRRAILLGEEGSGG